MGKKILTVLRRSFCLSKPVFIGYNFFLYFIKIFSITRVIRCQNIKILFGYIYRSFTGVLGKDKRVGMAMSQSSNQMFATGMSTTKTVPADLDVSSEIRTE